MGGRVRVDSALDVGTTVRWDVWLEPALLPVPDEDEALDEQAMWRMSHIQLNILLAEDNAMNQAVILRMLHFYDCHVRTLLGISTLMM